MTIKSQIFQIGWLIDGTGAPSQKNMLMEVKDGIIHKIQPALCASFSGELFPGTDIIDLSNFTLLPVLTDAHLHLFMSGTGDMAVRERQLHAGFDEMKPVIARHLSGLLDYGVVGIRDGGDYAAHSLNYKATCLNTDEVPVVLSVAGKAWRQKGRYGKLIGRPPEENSSLADAIRKETTGVDHVKLVNSGLNSLKFFGRETPPQFTLDEMKQAVTAAHEIGLDVMVHCNGKLPVQIAVEAGCDSIEHGFFMGTDNLKRMADRGTVWVPTTITMKAYAAHLPQNSPEAEMAQRNFEHQLRQIQTARALGVNVAVGSDAGSLGVHHGPGVFQEMTILVDAGYPVHEAVYCSSGQGAKLLKAGHIGCLAAGKEASFVAIPGTPEALFENAAESLPDVYIKGKRRSKAV